MRLQKSKPCLSLGKYKSVCKNVSCKLRPEKTKIVNVRGFSEKKYAKDHDFLGFTIRPSSYKHPNRAEMKTIPSIFVSRKSKSSILAKCSSI